MRKATILVVERDILVRHPLAQYLRDCGYVVIEASAAEDGRQAFADGKLVIDAVLIDVHSPTEGGFALASWIRSQFPAVQVLLAGTVAKAMQSAGDLCKRRSGAKQTGGLQARSRPHQASACGSKRG